MFHSSFGARQAAVCIRSTDRPTCPSSKRPPEPRHIRSTAVRPGDGQALKTINQLLAGVHIAATAEAIALARGIGLDPAV